MTIKLGDESVATKVWDTGPHTARPAAGNAGARYRETDTGVIYLDDGSTWRSETPGLVVKSADQTVTNSATLVNDNDLRFPIDANETWFVEAVLLAQAASTAADWSLNFTGPTGCTADTLIQSSAAGGGFVSLATTSTPPTTHAINVPFGCGAAAGTSGILLAGWFANGATAGSIQFQWAQLTAPAENNTIRKNSMLRLRRLA